MRKMPTLSTVLLSVSASAIQIRLLYGNENRSFYHDENKKVPSLADSLNNGEMTTLSDVFERESKKNRYILVTLLRYYG